MNGCCHQISVMQLSITNFSYKHAKSFTCMPVSMSVRMPNGSHKAAFQSKWLLLGQPRYHSRLLLLSAYALSMVDWNSWSSDLSLPNGSSAYRTNHREGDLQCSVVLVTGKWDKVWHWETNSSKFRDPYFKDLFSRLGGTPGDQMLDTIYHRTILEIAESAYGIYTLDLYTKKYIFFVHYWAHTTVMQ